MREGGGKVGRLEEKKEARKEGRNYEGRNSKILTFKNRASYIWDGRTATLQMLHFIYI